MALESLAALGLAANIIQFVEFGCKLFSESRELYKASDRLVEESVELEIISKALKRLSDDLIAIPSSTMPQSQAEANLLPLAKRCQAIADELLVAVNKLQANGGKGKWQCFRSALRRIWRSHKIDDMARKLDSICGHLNTCLINVLNAKQTGILSSIGSLLEATERLEKQHNLSFDALRVSTLDKIKILNENHTIYLQKMLSSQSQQDVMASHMEQLHSELKTLILTGRPLEIKSRKCIQILESLQYKRMTARYEKIVQAHAKTFEWIYDERPLSQNGELQHHFLQWLKNGNGFFWVTGKAGSGKSTLMKFITEHPKTRQALSQWASHQHLITASFYFWHAGTALQKSQEGLLRSLLYEIFRQCPNMIPDLFPERWALCEQTSLASSEWSHTELVNALAKVLSQPTMLLKRACFFIDGLDEYDGDHMELIRLLQDFSRPNNIKICASSRPWNVFGTAFGGGSCRMFRLQDLTRNDITLYVRETLEQNDLFNQLRKRDNTHCIELVEEVVSKAQGVFLWVFLVVRSLITGLTNADRVTDLRRRLRLLPADLESYFSHMLATIDTFYEKQTAQTFKIALHASEPQNIMTYVMLDELDEDPQFALHLDIREWQSTEIRSKTESMVLRINARGMGLLEVVRSQDSAVLGGDEVDFLHRTVRDFFRLRAIEDWIAHRLPLSFNIDQLLFNAILAQVKTMRRMNLWRDRGKLLRLVDDMMRYAYNLETNLERAPTILLDDLSHTISQHIQVFSKEESYHNDTSSFRQIRQWRTSFLSFAVQKDLKLYVAEKLDTRSRSTRSEDAYLICRALWPDVSKAPFGNREMLGLILEKGMRMTKADDSWHILFSEIAKGWAQAPDKEKILQLETISTLLLARENPSEAIRATCWNYLVYTLAKDWLSGSIELQRALKTMMSVLLEKVSSFEPAHGKRILWCKIMLEIFHSIKRPDVGPASKEIILEIIRTFLRHGASPGEVLHRSDSSRSQDLEKDHVPEHPLWAWNVIVALWQDPYFSTEQKAELRAMLSSSMNPAALPFRPYPTPGQTLDNPGQSLKRSASDFDFAVTVSPNQTAFKRRFNCTTTPVTADPPWTAGSWYDHDERPPTPFPGLGSDSD
ncbi:hypothetical protein JMJ35_004327 [Cladonia borealis]|uniref:NACHT domain-containing protein n=1 Tax=Cladonia borealis TaxID=184061 RepID=A0AA39UBD4_9LECA|nr:hypothetical protein JMJ35_004327 [Cladonia borealis]